jgi:hypothetical protein
MTAISRFYAREPAPDRGASTPPTAAYAPRLGAAALLAAVCLASRWGTLGLGVVNIDEAQYAAFASYLQGTGQSAFDAPILHVYTHWLFQYWTSLAPDRVLFAARLFTLLIAFASSWMIYRLGLRMVAWPLALWAAVLFVLFSVFSEGLTANREWYCLPLAIGSMLTFASAEESPGRPIGRWASSGALAGFAFWFKEQALVLAAPVAMELTFQILRTRERERAAAALAWYAAGAAAGLAAGALPMVWAGTLREQVEWLWNVEFSYVAEGYARGVGGDWLSALAWPLYLYSPWRRIWLVGLAAAFTAIALRPGVERRSNAPEEFLRESVARCVAFYAICGLVAVQAGGRFYAHYFLLPLPGIVLSTVGAVQWLLAHRRRTAAAAASSLLVAAVVADFLWAPSNGATFALGANEGASPPRVALVAAAFALGAAARIGWVRLGRALVPIAAAAVLMDSAAGSVRSLVYSRVFTAEFRPTFSSPRLADAIGRRARPGDRLFVWGWRPEIYLDAGLPAATRFASCLEVVGGQDEALVLAPRFDPRYMATLLEELDRFQPRFVVDASLSSFYGSMYNLDVVPPMKDYLDRRYVPVEEADGCVLYERDASAPRGDVSYSLDARLGRLDHLSRTFEHDMLHFELNRADLLAQHGRYDEAETLYERLRRLHPTWSVLHARLAVVDALKQPNRGDDGVRPNQAW